VASAIFLFLAAAAAVSASEPPMFRIADAGQPPAKVIVAEGASEATRAAAQTLADYLGRIASARFQVVSGDGREGIAVGLANDFPALDLAGAFDADGLARREQYLLRSHRRGLYAVAAADAGVSHAVWDLLYRLGHRQFFPGEVWEVVPRRKDLRIAVDANEKPDFLYRRIWYGYGTWDYNEQPLAEWYARNRAPGGFVLNTGHAYDGIIRRHKAEFDKHPEYYGLLDGERKSSKICIANPAVRELVVRYALDFFERSPSADSVSVDPSDGGGWCECAACAALGTPSDRALTLANDVSAALEAGLPGKYVAMYAYSHHSPPPAIRARPRVIISVATAFLKGGRTVEENIDGWKRQGVRRFGIREYYSVLPWDHDLPGRARGSNLAYLARTIPEFHRMGARFMSAESSDNWGANGLGYYIANRILWDVGEAERIDDLKADFLAKAFGPARAPVGRFYDLLDGSRAVLVSRHLLGCMYRCLRDAAHLAESPRIRARIDHLVLYTRYVELYRAYSGASGDKRQAAFERLIRHVYRMRRTMMVHAKGIYRTYAERDKRVSVPDEARWNRPEAGNPWKSSEPWTRTELDGFVARGVAANPVVTFKPVTYGHDLVPADRLNLPDVPPLEGTCRGRGPRTFYTWVKRAPATIALQVPGGLIAHYRARGPAKLTLYAVTDGDEKKVAYAEVPPDGVQRTVTLRSTHTGLHKLTVSDGMDCTEVVWPADTPCTVESSLASVPRQSGRRSAYLYVPRGTKVVGGYAEAAGGTLHDADGHKVLDLPHGEYFEVPVRQGQDGRLWSVRAAPGAVRLMTVPPYLAPGPNALLLPRDVVEADGPAGR